MNRKIKTKPKTIELSGGVKVTLHPHLSVFSYEDAEEIKERFIFAFGRQSPAETEGRIIFNLSSPEARRIGQIALILVATEKIDGADFELPSSFHDDNLTGFYDALLKTQSITPEDLRRWVTACEDHNKPPGDPNHTPESLTGK